MINTPVMPVAAPAGTLANVLESDTHILASAPVPRIRPRPDLSPSLDPSPFPLAITTVTDTDPDVGVFSRALDDTAVSSALHTQAKLPTQLLLLLVVAAGAAPDVTLTPKRAPSIDVVLILTLDADAPHSCLCACSTGPSRAGQHLSS